jgi:hypothetical protein
MDCKNSDQVGYGSALRMLIRNQAAQTLKVTRCNQCCGFRLFVSVLWSRLRLCGAANPNCGSSSGCDQCCGSGIRCLFDPGIRNRFFPDPGSRIPDLGSRIPDLGSRISDPGSQTHIFESILKIFWVKSSTIL